MLPDSWVQAINPPLEKLLQLQRVRCLIQILPGFDAES